MAFDRPCDPRARPFKRFVKRKVRRRIESTAISFSRFAARLLEMTRRKGNTLTGTFSRLKDRIYLCAIAQLVKRMRADSATLPLHDAQQPNVLTLRQAYPKIVIHRHQGRALLDGRHRADEDAIYPLFPERLKESAERDVFRLKWHRSWGDMAKKSACCHRSASSMPRAPAS
jgi:hypothetical protein